MNWKDMPLAHKIATIISFLAVAVWLVSNLQPNLLPFDPTYPAIAVFTLCEAVIHWDQKRTWAYLYIVGAVISLACSLIQTLHTQLIIDTKIIIIPIFLLTNENLCANIMTQKSVIIIVIENKV